MAVSRGQRHSQRLTSAWLCTLLMRPQPLLAQSTDCSLHPDDAACSLAHTLHVLHWIAGGLALLLLLVIALAIAVYRKNKSAELTPHD